MLETLNQLHSITKNTSSIIDLYNDLILSYVSILKYNSLSKKKEYLLEQLEILKKVSSTNESSEIIEKLKEINENMTLKETSMSLFEEDYFEEKNRIDDIKKKINNYKIKIETLKEHKKENSAQINKIIEEMETNAIRNENDNDTVSFSKRFQDLKKEAKNYQYEIKQTSEILNNLHLEFKKNNARFEILELKYQELLNDAINNKKNQNKIKDELGKRLKENLDKFNTSDLLKSTQEIHKKIQEIKNEMIGIVESNKFLNTNQPWDLKNVEEELKSLQFKIIDNQEISILLKKSDIIESNENFKKIEDLIQNLERLLNKFLLQIYLRLKIETMISLDHKSITYQLRFFQVRKKTILPFNELTTPEKVFFVIVLYLSIQIMLDFKNIIFSNLILPTTYNKRGSIFRTLKKIIPVFERENNLKSSNLIFIISNLELKEQIKDLNIITI